MKYLLAIAVVAGPASARPATLWVSSTFPQRASLPRAFTCDGAEIAPPLFWSGAPTETRSFAIIVEDVDADPPRANWVLAVPGNVTAIEGAPDGAIVGLDWDAPCPPRGRAHHYVFRVFALDADVAQPEMSELELEDAMRGHVLGHGELVAIYQHD